LFFYFLIFLEGKRVCFMGINSGDTAWIIVATALVLIMTPGLAFFYGGMVRQKNVLNTMMMSYGTIGLAIVMWVLVGYSISFGPDIAGLFGSLDWAGLNGVGQEASATYATTIPHMLFAAFQMMFAVITPALITGALAERMKFGPLLLFVGLWSIIVYYPLAHMQWSATVGADGNLIFGLLGNLGAIDFAGGNVVHISSGVSGLVACILLGKRKNHQSIVPHNIPYVLIGAALLFFGWIGFNAGSAVAANGLAAHALATTVTSAAMAMLSWMLVETIVSKKPTALGAATGLVVGLVAITPGAGFVPVWASIVIGLVVSPLCWMGVSLLKRKLGYDDALDAFGCHGIGGIWGGIATGLFATTAVNSAVPSEGLFFGGGLLGPQCLAILITIALAAVGTLVIFKVISLLMKVRVDDASEAIGLDQTEHGEAAYPSSPEVA
jgi:Amt family ammonium transporter